MKTDRRKSWKEGISYDAIHIGTTTVQLYAQLIKQLKAPDG